MIRLHASSQAQSFTPLRGFGDVSGSVNIISISVCAFE
jgi:hypothetical protein